MDRMIVHEAVETEDLPALQRAIEAGVDLEDPDFSDRMASPVGLAVEQGWTAGLDALLAAGASAEGSIVDSPLVAATQNGFVEGVERLLGKGAEVDAANEEGMTPLMVAGALGFPGLARRLVEAGANLELRDDSDGKLPSEHAQDADHPELASYLADPKAFPADHPMWEEPDASALAAFEAHRKQRAS